MEMLVTLEHSVHIQILRSRKNPMKMINRIYYVYIKHKYKLHLIIAMILLMISIIKAVNLFHQEHQLARQTCIVIIILGILVYCSILVFRLANKSK